MTPVLPWTMRDHRVNGYMDVLDADGETVATLIRAEDAKVIVAAVNASPNLALVVRLGQLLGTDEARL